MDRFLGWWISVYFQHVLRLLCVALSPFTSQSPADGQYFQTPLRNHREGVLTTALCSGPRIRTLTAFAC